MDNGGGFFRGGLNSCQLPCNKMATSALVCINLKTRSKSGGGGAGEGSVEAVSGDEEMAANTQQLVQALVDSGIIQLNQRATIRVVDSSGPNKHRPQDDPQPPLHLGTFAVKPAAASDTRSSGGILVETINEAGDSKVVVQNRPIVVQRSGLGAKAAGGGLLQLVQEDSRLQLVQLAAPPSRDETSSSRPTPPPATPSSTAPHLPDGEPIKLPDNLESLPKAEHFPVQRHRWNTNEEIAAILITFERHMDWQSKEVKIRPKSGSMLLYSRKKVRYRRDGYCWKKRKDGKTTREDHMKLKVQGTECIYGCYVHSAILPTFHRRCYWLLQNPDIVLVHYLNVPYPDDNKLVSPTLSLCADKKQWTKEELISQLKPMFYSEDEPEFNNELEISTVETLDTIVSQLLERQRSARASAICKQLECGCPDSTCTDAKTCSQPIRRIQATKDTNSDANQVSSTTGPAVVVSQRPIVQQGQAQERQLQVHHLHHTQQILSQGGVGGGPLVLNLSQIQNGGLLILNSSQQQNTSSVSSNNNSSSTSNSSANAIHQQPPPPPPPPPPPSSAHLVHRNAQAHNKEKQTSTPMEMESSCHLRNTLVGTKSDMHHQSRDKLVLSRYDSVRVGGLTKMEPGMTTDGPPEQKLDHEAAQNSHLQHTLYQSLDLSHEDIQQTLSANMPHSSRLGSSGGMEKQQQVVLGGGGSNMNGGEPGGGSGGGGSAGGSVLSGLEEIDFIDVNGGIHQGDEDDDVLVNLDAFEMLSDFPDFDNLDNNNHGMTSNRDQIVNSSNDNNFPGNNNNKEREATDDKDPSNNNCMDYREGTANITDFSPEWSYTQGGVKVLVTGPWYSTTSPYVVLFDSVPVPTTLVQSGVLRCFSPAHEVGFVSLQVACEGFVISNSALFEYKRREEVKSEETELESTAVDASGAGREQVLSGALANESLLRYSLVHRLDSAASRLYIKQEPMDLMEVCGNSCSSSQEEKMVSFISRLALKPWKDSGAVSSDWCATYKNMTLLHLAAALGYSRLLCELIQWRSDNGSLLLDLEVNGLSQDTDGCTPLMSACMHGHEDCVLLLYEWEPSAVSLLDTEGRSCVQMASLHGHQTLAHRLQVVIDSTSSQNFRLPSRNHLPSMRKQNQQTSPTRPIAKANSKSQEKAHVQGRHRRQLIDSALLSLEEDPESLFIHPTHIHRNISAMELHVSIPMTDVQKSSRHSSPGFNTEMHSMAKDLSDRLIKRPSVDSGIQLQSSLDSLSSLRSSTRQLKSVSTPKQSRFDRSMSLPISSPQDQFFDTMPDNLRHSPRRMDFALCEVMSGGSAVPGSPCHSGLVTAGPQDIAQPPPLLQPSPASPIGEQDARVLTLAEQIIAAMPERIKNESDSESMTVGSDDIETMSLESPLLLEDHPSSSSSCCFEGSDFNFDLTYRYYDVGTPCSSLSPGSCLPSPPPNPRSPSPPPNTADFQEFLHASNSVLFEKDFSNLTLSDREQRELYEAAKVIQKAYRSYKGRKKSEQDKERQAAILIQNCYRRYKQFVYFKQMTRAAMVIQNGFRSYCENKRHRKNQEVASGVAHLQNSCRMILDTSQSSPALKRTYSQRRQNQAARKIQQFMRQSKNKLQRERAEREKLEDLCKVSLQN